MGKRWGKGGYRPGYSEQHSPNYAMGLADGKADAERLAGDKEAVGPTPPNPAYRTMYDRGYNDGLNNSGEAA